MHCAHLVETRRVEEAQRALDGQRVENQRVEEAQRALDAHTEVSTVFYSTCICIQELTKNASTITMQWEIANPCIVIV